MSTRDHDARRTHQADFSKRHKLCFLSDSRRCLRRLVPRYGKNRPRVVLQKDKRRPRETGYGARTGKDRVARDEDPPFTFAVREGVYMVFVSANIQPTPETSMKFLIRWLTRPKTEGVTNSGLVEEVVREVNEVKEIRQTLLKEGFPFSGFTRDNAPRQRVVTKRRGRIG